MPLVTIITVTFNAAAMLEETILSVLGQRFTDYEYLVIDGNSNDGTQEIARKYLPKLQLTSERDYGIYDAMNKGISKARGEWIYFLNAGDTFYDDEVLWKLFHAKINPDIELIYGNIHTKNHPSGSNYTQGKQISLQDFYYRVGLCHQAAFTKHSAFDSIGIYDHFNYRILADQEWFVRFFKSGKKSFYINLVIANYEIVGESFIKRNQSHDEHLKIVANHFSAMVKFRNQLFSPLVKMKIKLIQQFGTSGLYKLYRKTFYSD